MESSAPAITRRTGAALPGPDAMFSFFCLGAKICVRADSPAALDGATRILPPGSSLAETGDEAVVYSMRSDSETVHRLIRNGSRIGLHSSLPEMLGHLESRLHETVALQSPYIFVHAGVVQIGNQVIVLPGVSRAGKSTLVHELVHRGALYYSDEYAVLDEHGQVHAYPKPLSMRQPDGLSTRSVLVEQIGGRAATGPNSIALIALLRYRPAKGWSLQPMTPAETLFALLQNTLAARARLDEVLPVLAKAVANARGVRGVRGEASDASSQLLPHLEAPRS